MCCMEYVFWIVLRAMLARAHFLQHEANLGETKKIETSYKLGTEHSGSAHVTNRIGEKMLF